MNFSLGPFLANFYEKALFVKGRRGGRPLADATALSALRAMLLSALSVSSLFGDSVHCEIRLFGHIEGAAIFVAVSTRRGWTKFAIAQSPHARSEARSGNKSRGHQPL
jgi:hypothetical protein